LGFVWAKNKLLLKKAPEQRGYNIAQCENRIILSLQIDKSNSLLAVKMVQIVDQIGILYIIGLIKFMSQYFFVTDKQDSRGFFCMGLIQRSKIRPVYLGEIRRWLLDGWDWCGRLPDNVPWQSEHHV